MQKKTNLNLSVLLILFKLSAQTYTSYYTGNTNDVLTTPQGGICLMGGGAENDEAVKWFLNRASGGDILVLRTSGTDGYNNYMYSQLGIAVNSVETIVFNSASAKNNSYIHSKIKQAEAIWVAGGDQWEYISYWRNTVIDSLINDAITKRNIVIGGTSAGMAIQGKFYFTARNGTITSAIALNNPYSDLLTVDSARFIQNKYLTNVITDTHFDNPNRKGRAITFMARVLTDKNFALKVIACDESTAVCISPDGIARVYGNYPNSDDNAWFIQPNCGLANTKPEICTVNNPLTWDLWNLAVKACRVKGTPDGSGFFDLTNWRNTNGNWENWFVNSGVLSTIPSNQIDCSVLSVNEPNTGFNGISVTPNPVTNYIKIMANEPLKSICISNNLGTIVYYQTNINKTDFLLTDLSIKQGVYFIRVSTYKSGYSKLFIKY